MNITVRLINIKNLHKVVLHLLVDDVWYFVFQLSSEFIEDTGKDVYSVQKTRVWNMREIEKPVEKAL